MKPTRITLVQDGLLLQGMLVGPMDAPLVVLVHGFPDTPHGWNDIAPELVAAGYRVFMPWLRGYTPDSAKRDASYDPVSAAEDLHAWRVQLKAETAHLVGHDWGAIVAMMAVVQAPDDWQSLTLLAIPPLQRPERAWRQMPRQFVRSSYMLFLQSERAPELIQKGDAGYLRRLWQKWSPGWDFRETQFAPVREAFSHPDVAWAATRYYRSLFTLLNPRTQDLFIQLRHPLKVPTLVLAGARDGCLQAGLAAASIDPALFPAGVRDVVLPDCGHFLQAERPRAVLDELLPHLRATAD